MKSVLVIANNLEQASFRLRVAALAGPLERRGWRWVVAKRPRGLLARRRLLRSAADHQAVILQRKLLDPAEARLLRRHARRIIYDVDDAVMLHPRPTDRLSRWRRSRRYRATIAAADQVVAGSEELAEVFREAGCRVAVIPTVVDPAGYRPKEHRPADAPALVWIGSRSTLPYLGAFLPSLVEAARRVRGLRLLVIADRGIEGEGLEVEHVPWSLADEADALCRGDIGIAPTPDDPWARGKCGFKVVQYMAAGLPVVASPVGANRSLVLPGKTGFLPADPGGWPAAIALLAGDVALRARMGGRGRRRVEEEYSLARAAQAWERVLEGGGARGGP